jgi:hypothetical protein
VNTTGGVGGNDLEIQRPRHVPDGVQVSEHVHERRSHVDGHPNLAAVVDILEILVTLGLRPENGAAPALDDRRENIHSVSFLTPPLLFKA